MLEYSTADSKAEILSAAFALFSEIGYRNTSYTAIAERSGNGRPLVQYYFPKKEQLAVDLIARLMSSIDEVLGRHSEDAIIRMLQVGQIYYSALVDTEGMRLFAAEVLADRGITSRIIMINADWSLSKLDQNPAQRNETRASLQATGGVYELLYKDLIEAEIRSPGEYALQNVASFLTFRGERSYLEEASCLQEHLFPKGKAETLASNALAKVLGTRVS